MLTSAMLILFIMAHWYVAWWAFKNDDRQLQEQTGWLRMAVPEGSKAASDVSGDQREYAAPRDLEGLDATTKKRQQPPRRRSKRAHRRDKPHMTPGGRRRGL